jgi:chromate reductase
MVAVISGTNRPGSQTSVVARFCMQWLAEHGIPAGLVELTSMNDLSVTPKQFNSDHQDEVIKQTRDEILIPANHWIVVSPEYNGSFPGILKWWIDLLSVKNRNTVFKNKKASLIGVASGRAGNLRGMDHLTGVLHYLGMLVMPEKLPISKIEDLITSDGKVTPGLAFTLEKYLMDAFLEK